MLCKIWGFCGGDYEECRLLEYKNPVRTSQETLPFLYRVQPVKAMYDLRFSQRWPWKVPSSGMLRSEVLVRTYVSEEISASIILVTRIGELRALVYLAPNSCCEERLCENSFLPVTDHWCLYGCEMLRIRLCLTEGEVVTSRVDRSLYPRNILYFCLC
jgi:hypothetical protein